MKTYPFILINKNNMKEIEHFKSADSLALRLSRNDGKSFQSSHWVVVKDEKTVVDLSSVNGKVNIVEQYNELKKIFDHYESLKTLFD
jgi:hypothetical protein